MDITCSSDAHHMLISWTSHEHHMLISWTSYCVQSHNWRSICSDCSELTEEEETRRDKVWEVLCTEVKYLISQLQPLRIVSIQWGRWGLRVT